MNRPLNKLPALALALSLGLGAVTAAVADDHTRGNGPGMNMGPRHDGPGQMQRFSPMGGGMPMLAFACAPDAGSRIDAMLDHAETRLDLSGDQKTLFEDFRTSLLDAQQSFSDTCATFGTSDDNGNRPDLVARLTRHQIVLQAQLDALDEVLPSLEAVYDTLSDDQKAALMPPRLGRDRDHRGLMSDRRGDSRDGDWKHGDPNSGAPDAPPAPVPAPAGTSDTEGDGDAAA